MLRVVIDGRTVSVPVGTTVAAAVLGGGFTAFRHSVTGEPRAPICGMGICFECRLTIDRQPHRRTCQVLCHDGMTVETE
jgi:sarcosine oxidase subunit alpha